MKLLYRSALTACLTLATLVVTAADSRDSLLVDSQWLKKSLGNPGLVLLHVGDKTEYNEGHIARAHHISLQDLHVTDRTPKTGLVLEMPSPGDLQRRLESFGISDDSRVIVYYGRDWVTPATRILFTLDYAGLGDRASILDGGMGAWVKAGGAVTQEVATARTGKLSPLKIRPIVVDAAWVRQNADKPGFALIDGRASVFYDGVDTGSSQEERHRTGHIAGAGNAPFTSITNDDVIFKSPGELKQILAKAGVKPGDIVVGYCHIGMQTTAALLAARMLGHKVLLYDGSFQDWSRRADHPIENPAAKRAP